MSRITRTLPLVVLAALLSAVFAAAASPANPSPSSCADGYDVYLLNPLTDTLLAGLDLNGDGIVCVNIAGDVARVVDNSGLAGLLPTGLVGGFTAVNGPVTIEGSTITIDDIFEVDQRGNRNTVAGVGVCSNNTGNSCFSNNKFLQNIRIVVADDVLGL